MSHYINTVGLPIIVETGQDLTSATNLLLNVKKPDGSWTTWSATLHGTTQMKHITVAGDIALDGWYTIYPTCTIGTWTGAGKPARFPIKDPQKPDRYYNV